MQKVVRSIYLGCCLTIAVFFIFDAVETAIPFEVIDQLFVHTVLDFYCGCFRFVFLRFKNCWSRRFGK